MVYYTGDIHSEVFWVHRFCKRLKLTRDDIVVILGDVAANYYADERDLAVKNEFAKLKPTILCIHGNHECRPEHIPSYKTMQWHGGTVWYEEEYPNLLFAKDGEVYTLGGLRHLVIGGAFSVDVEYRRQNHWQWWPDEQPSEITKRYVEQQIRDNRIDVILSHTCPAKYTPLEAFLPGLDQSRVDRSTEQWLDRIEAGTDYLAWFCGHWHINKRIDRIHFLAHAFESCEEIQEIALIRSMTDKEIGIGIGQFNTLTGYGVRYALGMPALAADTMYRIIRNGLDALHGQTKAGIIQDIEKALAQNSEVADLDVWNRIVQLLKDDLERRKSDG